ncbi:hypothetical protein M1247_01030 [Mycobacterium sp. 21AC1]|uniref:hypothetical protein n=1 Tax=[Mycobacterium] appelbergii TaxID=2939269 RepID=UPI0029395255|nr:hypothetical protein [Mycobacterium sp. 21AC1]MDV3123485.1 hypothetical protein [Mycobacterium sp. 21AC1]
MTSTDRAPGKPAPVVGYAYPWDVIGDPGFVDRALALGISRIALAAAYHTTRAATPLHPRTRLVTARSAALYRPVRSDAWAGRRLVPAPAEWVGDVDPFGHAAADLVDAGIEVAAWIVLTHSTRVGEANRDLAVVNCFGEAYPYALCPQSPLVREYSATLAAEAVRDVPCSGVVLEACGQLGIVHGGHHEKTEGAYDTETQRLLSICCCTACQDAWRAEGLDPGQVVAGLRAGAPDPTVLDTLLEIRHDATDVLRRTVIEAVRAAAPGRLEIALHGQPNPWATGALPGLTPTAADDVDVVVSQCWATGEQSVETVHDLVKTLDGRAAPASYITVLPPTTEESFGPHVAALLDAGARELHLYHLGLAGPDRRHLLAEAARSALTRSTS